MLKKIQNMKVRIMPIIIGTQTTAINITIELRWVKNTNEGWDYTDNYVTGVCENTKEGAADF